VQQPLDERTLQALTSPAGARSAWLARAGALPWLLGALALIQVVAARFGEPDTPYSVAHRSAWLAAQEPAPFLILGDSTAHHLSASAFAEGTGARALNGAVRGSTAMALPTELGHLPWTPRTIVVGLCAIAALSDVRPSELPEIEIETLADRMRLRGAAQGLLETIMPVYRQRTTLRMRAGELRRRLLGLPLPSSADSGVIDEPDGSQTSRLPSTPSRAAAAKLVADFLPGGRATAGARLAALRAFAGAARARGIDVVYVLTPLSSPLRDELAARGFSGFGPDLLRSVTAELGGRWLDCRAAVPDAGFYDVDHLRDGPERAAFSRALGRLVAARADTCRVD
jgi:hypothetical protein